jgi:hypothetical protein
MNIKITILAAVASASALMMSCSEKQDTPEQTAFTRTDSLTEVYLNLQDSMLLAWNLMMNDDNQKIRAMSQLLHELKVCGQFDPKQLEALDARLQQLTRIRYTHRTMSNSDLVEEYDFASNSVITELISLAESHKAYGYNKVLQGMVSDIQNADQRVVMYRAQYDSAAHLYNDFLERNREYLRDIAEDGKLEKKPLFQMASE